MCPMGRGFGEEESLQMIPCSMRMQQRKAGTPVLNAKCFLLGFTIEHIMSVSTWSCPPEISPNVGLEDKDRTFERSSVANASLDLVVYLVCFFILAVSP